MERIVGGIFIEAAMPSSCSHSWRQFLTIIHAFAHTESEKHSPPSVAKISARYTLVALTGCRHNVSRLSCNARIADAASDQVPVRLRSLYIRIPKTPRT